MPRLCPTLLLQVFGFLGVTTTNFLASNSITAENLTQEQRLERLRVARRLQCYALTCGALFGTVVMVLLFWVGDQLLVAMGTPMSVFMPAKSYLLIRALAGPASMLNNVAYGALLG